MRAINATRIKIEIGMADHHLLPCLEAIQPNNAANTANIHPNGRLPIMNGDTINAPRRRIAAIPSSVGRLIPAILSLLEQPHKLLNRPVEGQFEIYRVGLNIKRSRKDQKP
jgi:hypothetical protein